MQSLNRIWMLVCVTAVAGACSGPTGRGPLPEPREVGAQGKADGFDWSQDGDGSFSITTTASTLVTLGTIPADQQDVKIQVRAGCDVDLQLIDEDDTQVVHWKYGVIKGQTEATGQYKQLQITWSGYGGIDGEPGNEDLEITGTMPSQMTAKLYAVGGCDVTVSYSWTVAAPPPPTYKPFAERLDDLVQKYPQIVFVATKQGKPAIFVKTALLSGEAAVNAFYADLYETIGTNTLMAWNPAGENYFHLRTPTSTQLEARFRNKAMTVYGSPHYWDPSAGNLDNEYDDDDNEGCYESCGEDCYEDCYETCGEDDVYDCACYQDCTDTCYEGCTSMGQVSAERAVALIVISNAEMTLLDDYLAAITDEPSTNLGPSDYYGGVPPYFTGDPNGKHNCTSWFSEWLYRKVSTEFPTYYNPAALLKAYTTGGYSGQLAAKFRALLVFNHPNPPAHGATIPKSFPLDFGH